MVLKANASLAGEQAPERGPAKGTTAPRGAGPRYQDRLKRVVQIQVGASPLRRHDSSRAWFRAAFAEDRGAGAARPSERPEPADAYDRHRAAKQDAARGVPIERADRQAADSGWSGQWAPMTEVRELLDEEVARRVGARQANRQLEILAKKGGITGLVSRHFCAGHLRRAPTNAHAT